MIGPTLSIDEDDWLEEWENLEIEVTTKLILLLQVTGVEAVSWLRSLTSGTQPPVRVGRGERKAHPGHWADITGQLSGSYGFQVLGQNGTRIIWSERIPVGAEGVTETPSPAASVTVRGEIPHGQIHHRIGFMLENTADYAAALESKHGYWVLSGATDPGSPLYESMTRAARRLGFTLR